MGGCPPSQLTRGSGKRRGFPTGVKVKVRTLDIAPLREIPPQKRSGIGPGRSPRCKGNLAHFKCHRTLLAKEKKSDKSREKYCEKVNHEFVLKIV